MLDSDFGFDDGESDLDFGIEESSSSSDDEDVVHASVNDDILVEAQIDNSPGDDDIVATAQIIMGKRHHRRYTIQEKLIILCQVCQ